MAHTIRLHPLRPDKSAAVSSPKYGLSDAGALGELGRPVNSALARGWVDWLVG
jgi:hypothetical protein